MKNHSMQAGPYTELQVGSYVFMDADYAASATRKPSPTLEPACSYWRP